jgi:hypothetical protein
MLQFHKPLHTHLIDATGERFEPWAELAERLRDEPELHTLSGVDRVLLLGAALHRDLRCATRDVRRVALDAADAGESILWLRASEANPFHPPDAEGMAEPWEVPEPFSATPDPRGAAALHAWLQVLAGCTSHRAPSAEEQGRFADAVFAMLARDLGPPARWIVHHPLTSERLRLAYCCGYDALLVSVDSAGLLFVMGMYCG